MVQMPRKYEKKRKDATKKPEDFHICLRSSQVKRLQVSYYQQIYRVLIRLKIRRPLRSWGFDPPPAPSNLLIPRII